MVDNRQKDTRKIYTKSATGIILSWNKKKQNTTKLMCHMQYVVYANQISSLRYGLRLSKGMISDIQKCRKITQVARVGVRPKMSVKVTTVLGERN